MGAWVGVLIGWSIGGGIGLTDSWIVGD
jgi:hypothetical protein